MNAIEWRFVDFDGFEWDVGNFQKVQKHGISLLEFDRFFEQKVLVIPDSLHSTKETRYVAIGGSISGRLLFVVFTFRRKGIETNIRVISARYIHRYGKELKFYEKFKKEIEKKSDGR